MRTRLKRIHVNRHNIAHNRKGGPILPVFTVKDGKINWRSNRVQIIDKLGEVVAEFVYRPNKPLSCGAVAWIETRAEVRIEVGDYDGSNEET